MRIACISDTHGLLPPAKDFQGADAIIHAGDIGQDRYVQEWLDTTWHPWLEAVKVPVYATLGNHDFPAKWGHLRDTLYIDEAVEIGGVKFWFSPWSPKFYDWAWMKTEKELVKTYAKIPEDVEIIVSHSPPLGLCDKYAEQCVGSKALRDRMHELPYLKMLICGHIHSGHGHEQCGQVSVINVASVDEAYMPLPKEQRITWLEI